MSRQSHQQPDVLVVGAGPAGLAAAIELKKLGCGSVVVVEREKVAGGIPRHCYHTGFGIRDLKRITSGPKYAAHYVRQAMKAGITILTETTAIGWNEALEIQVTSPNGVHHLSPRAVLLATGCRERPRPARFVPGDRPAGIYTTAALQQLVYLRSQKVGSRAVVIGAEHVSFSAVDTLSSSGCATIAMITEFPDHQTYRPFHWWVAGRKKIPVRTRCKLVGINGRSRVESVEYIDLQTQQRHTIACDTVIFTGDWIPDGEFARFGGLAINKWTKGPEIDQGLCTSRPGVFAAGNLLRGAEMADTAAAEGRYAAGQIMRYLDSPNWPAPQSRIPITPLSPLKWVSPNTIDPHGGGSLPRNQLVFRVDSFLGKGQVQLLSESRVIAERGFAKLLPNQWYGLKLKFEDFDFETLAIRYLSSSR
jgi:NADPH-dependent 2,4-dienoyl-CoA reductase/sulfur reductase-like enzyme